MKSRAICSMNFKSNFLLPVHGVEPEQHHQGPNQQSPCTRAHSPISSAIFELGFVLNIFAFYIWRCLFFTNFPYVIVRKNLGFLGWSFKSMFFFGQCIPFLENCIVNTFPKRSSYFIKLFDDAFLFVNEYVRSPVTILSTIIVVKSIRKPKDFIKYINEFNE